MKITQIREKEDAEALSVLDFDLLMEKIKTETKTRPVTGLRQALHFVLPGEPCSFAGKLPKIMPAAVFGRVNGVRRMKVYNGIVELTVGPLAGKVEVELVKKKRQTCHKRCLPIWGRAEIQSRYGRFLPVRTEHCRKHRKKRNCFRHMLIVWL